MICSLGTLPTWGPDRLFLRDDGKHHGTDGERKLFAAENASWKKLASKMAGSGVGADLFISAGGGAYMDIATLGEFHGTLFLGKCCATTNIMIRPCRFCFRRRDFLLSQLARAP